MILNRLLSLNLIKIPKNDFIKKDQNISVLVFLFLTIFVESRLKIRSDCACRISFDVVSL